MKKIKVILAIFIGMSLLAPVGPARADSAPPRNPPGGDVSPEGGTEVQMVAEQVIYDFRQFTNDNAQVSAWFLFHNTSDTDENLDVRFPLNGDERGQSDPNTGEFTTYYPLIEDFTAAIGGQNLPTRVVKDTDPNAAEFFLNGYGDMYWSVFPVSFPAGKDVKLTVQYTFKPTEELNYALISYVLATGAGWKGPIGTADVIFRFPYILNDINVLENYDDVNGVIMPYSWGIPTPVVENEIRFHWDNLEPTNQSNISFYILQPSIWQEILRRRVQVIGTPRDATAWEGLAKAYAAAGVEKHGMFSNPKLATMYISACEQALTLDPNNIDFHLEFAQNMVWASIFEGDPNLPYYRAIAENELATVLTLDPANEQALNIIDENQDFHPLTLSTPGPFPTPFLPTYTPYNYTEPTLTPAAIATDIPTSTVTVTLMPQPSATAPFIPSATSTPLPVEPAKNSTWLFGLVGILLIGSGFAGGWLVRAKKADGNEKN